MKRFKFNQKIKLNRAELRRALRASKIEQKSYAEPGSYCCLGVLILEHQKRMKAMG